MMWIGVIAGVVLLVLSPLLTRLTRERS
jgi:hypothetical protein